MRQKSNHEELVKRIKALEQGSLQQKQLELDLRKNQERYRALYNRKLLCIFICDFKGQFLDANEAALNLLGYSREELPSLSFS